MCLFKSSHTYRGEGVQNMKSSLMVRTHNLHMHLHRILYLIMIMKTSIPHDRKGECNNIIPKNWRQSFPCFFSSTALSLLIYNSELQQTSSIYGIFPVFLPSCYENSICSSTIVPDSTMEQLTCSEPKSLLNSSIPPSAARVMTSKGNTVIRSRKNQVFLE